MVAGEFLSFRSGVIELKSDIVEQDSFPVVNYVFNNVVEQNTSFIFIVKNGAVFHVSGYVNDNKQYGLITIQCYSQKYNKSYPIESGKIGNPFMTI